MKKKQTNIKKTNLHDLLSLNKVIQKMKTTYVKWDYGGGFKKRKNNVKIK